ncbi:DUF418 domain-containing protein [Corynebacterium camporealensis]
MSENALSTAVHAQTGETAQRPSRRWRSLDALRGFAIAGILFVNAVDITHATVPLRGEQDPIREILNYTVQGRFVPLFVFLFGMSMWFTRRSAMKKGTSVWVALLLRMVTVFAFGAALWFFYPGNILVEYGAVGLIMIPFAVLCPPVVSLILGAALTVVSFGVFGGGLSSLPGLILLGQAAAHWEWYKRLENPNRPMLVFTVIAVAAAIPAIWWQTNNPGDPRFTTAGGAAGGLMAAAYLGLFALAYWTPARAVLLEVFEPMGKMALSNYCGAAVIVWAAARVVDFESTNYMLPLMFFVIAILGVQSLISRLWLKSFRYGPLEWLWRVATWREIVPMKK